MRRGPYLYDANQNYMMGAYVPGSSTREFTYEDAPAGRYYYARVHAVPGAQTNRRADGFGKRRIGDRMRD
jgi:hypothetical protein